MHLFVLYRTNSESLFQGYRVHGWPASTHILRIPLCIKVLLYINIIVTNWTEKPTSITECSECIGCRSGCRSGQLVAPIARHRSCLFLLHVKRDLPQDVPECATVGSHEYKSGIMRIPSYHIIPIILCYYIAKSPIFTHLSSSLVGLTTLRAHKGENIFQRIFDECQDVHSSAWCTFLGTSHWFGIWLDWIVVVYIACATFTCLALRDGKFLFLFGYFPLLYAISSISHKRQWGWTGHNFRHHHGCWFPVDNPAIRRGRKSNDICWKGHRVQQHAIRSSFGFKRRL